jgi:hypothetical protein
LILAGRGFGETCTGAEWVRANMRGDTPLTGGRRRHVALIAETAADARDVMVGETNFRNPEEHSVNFCCYNHFYVKADPNLWPITPTG